MIDTSQKIQSYFVHVVELASELCSQSRWGKLLFIATPQVCVKEHFSFFDVFFVAHIWGFAQFWWSWLAIRNAWQKRGRFEAYIFGEVPEGAVGWEAHMGLSIMITSCSAALDLCPYIMSYDNIWYVYAKFEFLAKAGKAQESLTAGASQYLWVIHVCKTHVKASWIYACIFSLTQDSTAAGT